MKTPPYLVFRRRGDPTEAQLRSGNYPKRREPWKGLVIRFENEAGSVRSGVKPDGSRWETRMIYPYGYFERSEGVDGDEVDVFVGPYPDTAPMVYIVHQRKVGDWVKYDEDKCFVGFMSADDARAAFLANYDDPRFLGPITEMPVEEFVAKVKATYARPAMIKALLFLSKAHVPMHLRHLRSGRVVIVHPYDNRRHARDDHTLDLFAGVRPPAGGKPAKPTIDSVMAEDGELRRIMEEDTRNIGGVPGHTIRQDAQGVIVGALTGFDRIVKENGEDFRQVYDAFAPTRAKLRELFGDKVTLYRADEIDPARKVTGKPTLYFGSRELAEKFAQNGRKVEASEIPVDDILAAPHFPNGYWEFIVRNPAAKAAEPTSGAPADESAYLDALAMYHAERDAYRRGDGTLISSRENPQTMEVPPVGSWRIARAKGAYGRDIDELRELDPDTIEISEDTGAAKWPDVERYAGWMLSGDHGDAPPIDVVQTDGGPLKVANGHRRLLAAKLTGKPIKAWVSWAVHGPSGAPVGLTYELAAAGAEPIPVRPPRPDYTMFADDRTRFEVSKRRVDLLRADRETYERAMWDEMNRRWDAGDDVYFNTMTRQTRVTPKTREAMRFRNGRIELFQGRRGGKEKWIPVGPSGQVIDTLAHNLGMPSGFEREMARPHAVEPEEPPEPMTDSQAHFQVARLLDLFGPDEKRAAEFLTAESLGEVLAAWQEDNPGDKDLADALKRLRPDLF